MPANEDDHYKACAIATFNANTNELEVLFSLGRRRCRPQLTQEHSSIVGGPSQRERTTHARPCYCGCRPQLTDPHAS